MFYRISILPRLNVFARQLNSSKKNFKNTTTATSTITNSQSEKTTKTESSGHNNNKFSNKDNYRKNQNFIKGIKSDIAYNKNIASSEKEIETKVSDAHEGTYKLILAKFSDTQISNEEYINTCQGLIDLFSSDLSVADKFIKEPIKSQVTSKLKEFITSNNFDNQSFVTIATYLARIEPKEFAIIDKNIESTIPKLNIEQLLGLITIIRTVNQNKLINLKKVTDNEILSLIRNKIDELKTYDSIIKTIKLFQNDQQLLKSLEDQVLKMSENFTTDNWIDLLNTSSIIKRRNISIIETCAYNINGQNISLASIQKCLLSCGVLNYRDDQFMKFLVKRVHKFLDEHESNSKWVNENKVNLFSIISSIGMMNLRDKDCLNSFCNILASNCQDSRLIINLIITCGSLNYNPHSSDKLVDKINLSDFNLQKMDRREKMFLLNYVWSLCMLKQPKSEFIDAVLKKDFWEEFIGNDENESYKRPILMKLLNINLYTQMFVDDYNGVLLPAEMNSSNFANVLKLHLSPWINHFFSTLSSFRSQEKYFKTNMLTPFGIVVDALMVIDENGSPCKIADYFNEQGQLETKHQNEKKIAFKVVDLKDIISFGNKLSGNISMQLLLLKELGYTPITVTQNELLNLSVTERVGLIKKKLEMAAQNKD